MLTLMIVHELMCIYLFGTVFVRAVLMDEYKVHADVRLVFWFSGMAALWGIAAPVVSAWTPSAFSVVVTAAFCAVQCVTGRYWKNRVPDEFCRPGLIQHKRRATDQAPSASSIGMR